MDQVHKFEYVISGIELNDDQKAAISESIAAAVSGVLIGSGSRPGNYPGLIKGKVWGSIGGGKGPINGGRLLIAAELPQLAKQLEGIGR
jgi:hypothetical protein